MLTPGRAASDAVGLRGLPRSLEKRRGTVRTGSGMGWTEFGWGFTKMGIRWEVLVVGLPYRNSRENGKIQGL